MIFLRIQLHAQHQHNTTQHAWTTMNIERAKNVLNIPKQTIQPNVDNFNKNFCTLCKKQIALCERAKKKANRKRRKQWSQVIGIAHLFCEVQKLIDREWLRPQKFKVSTWDRSFSENNFSLPCYLLIGIIILKQFGMCVLPISVEAGFLRQRCLPVHLPQKQCCLMDRRV